jgi:hypothetical protein
MHSYMYTPFPVLRYFWPKKITMTYVVTHVLSALQILGARRLTYCKFHIEDAQF